MTALFVAGPYSARMLAENDVPALQTFFETNPEYFFAVAGEPPDAQEAQNEFTDLPPAGMTFTERHVIGFHDASGAMVGMAHVLSDFLAEGVGHIGLFIVASALHGRGVGLQLYRGLEGWMQQHGGARWLRLGAVVGNVKAERFWSRCGYQELRQRRGVVMGLRTNDLRVLVKPLDGHTIEHYLARVERDRPESTSP